MARLIDSQIDLIAQALAGGMGAEEAYQIADCRAPAPARREIQAILDRLIEIKRCDQDRADVSVITLIAEAEQARVAAMKAGSFSAAVAAVREKGVLSGKRVEKAEIGNPGQFENMTDDELREFLDTKAKGLGYQRASCISAPIDAAPARVKRH